MKAKKIPQTEAADTQKKPDLRNGIHGSLMNNSFDAGQSSASGDDDLKLATPDFAVPAGQTTHE